MPRQLTRNTTLFLREEGNTNIVSSPFFSVEEDIQAQTSFFVKVIRHSCWAFSCVQIIIPSLLPAQCQRGLDDGGADLFALDNAPWVDYVRPRGTRTKTTHEGKDSCNATFACGQIHGKT